MELTQRQTNFLETLEKSLGILSVALQKNDISKDEYDAWLKNIHFKKKLDDVKETSIDYVENQLLKQINQGDLSAIQFYLKTKGKKRGY